MTRRARWLLGGVALTAAVALAALAVTALRGAPQIKESSTPARTERQERRLSTAEPERARARRADPAPVPLDAPLAPILEDLPDADDLAEARPSESKPLAAEAPAKPLAAEQPARPEPTTPEVAPELPDETPASPEAMRPKPRQVSLVQLQVWSEPGMCGSSEGNAARQSLIATFQLWDGGEQGQFRVDPRLPLEAINPILGYLGDAEQTVAARLKLQVPRPETFLYYDQRLLRAAACVNSEVVAYYDGSMHVVPGDADVRTSVIHEYTHHALFSSGLMGPAWAHEGLAMNLAQENWWMDQRWLSALLDHPLGIDDLDERVPYKLVPEQALEFYAQSAALVACVLDRHHWQPDALFAALRNGANNGGETLVYELPEIEYPSFLRGCVERWSKAH